MNNLQYIFIFVLLVSINYFSRDLSAAEDSITLKLIMSDSEFTVSLRNEGAQSMVVNKRFSIGSIPKFGELYIRIYSETGDEVHLPFKVNIGVPDIADYILLYPNEEVGRSFDMGFHITHFLEMKKGKYKIRLEYFNRYDNIPELLSRVTVFKGPIESDFVEIEIDMNPSFAPHRPALPPEP